MNESPEPRWPEPAPSVDSARNERFRKIGFVVRDLIIAGAIVWGVSVWRNADLLQTGGRAPDFSLASLDGQNHSLGSAAGKPVLLYFFAPWCKVCGATAHNVRALRASRPPEELTVYAVALSYNSVESVRQFVRDHDLGPVPVLLGSDDVLDQYNIRAFPTFYTIDAQGIVSGRTVGYTSEIGLRLRTPDRPG